MCEISKYENRIVVFIDVLDFKSIIHSSVDESGKDDEAKIGDIIWAYEAIRGNLGLSGVPVDLDETAPLPETSKQVSIFSDSIVVSFRIEEQSEVFWTLLDIQGLIIYLLEKGMLCRGAIVKGKLIHTSKYIFGPAMIEAYILESKAALYPRIILDETILDTGSKYHAEHHDEETEREYIEDILSKDTDGMYYIDYFSKAQSELNHPEDDFPDYIENLGHIIRDGLDKSQASKQPSVLIKFLWMKERFNRMVCEAKETYRGFSDPDIAEYYQNLKPID